MSNTLENLTSASAVIAMPSQTMKPPRAVIASELAVLACAFDSPSPEAETAAPADAGPQAEPVRNRSVR